MTLDTGCWILAASRDEWAESKAPWALRFAGAVHRHHPFAFSGKDAVTASLLLRLCLIPKSTDQTSPGSGLARLVGIKICQPRRCGARRNLGFRSPELQLESGMGWP